jgi:hypothetical protein
VSQRVSGYQRQPDEVYETPRWVTHVVVPYLRKHCLRVWEPADGPKSMLAQALGEAGFLVIASRHDFLSTDRLPDPQIDSIVTNPPYGLGGRLASRFIANALDLVPVVAMLLKIDFDSGKTRTHLFRDCPAFAHKIVLLDRIVWFEHEGAAGPSENHAWYVFNKKHRGAPTINYARRSDHT